MKTPEELERRFRTLAWRGVWVAVALVVLLALQVAKCPLPADDKRLTADHADDTQHDERTAKLLVSLKQTQADGKKAEAKKSDSDERVRRACRVEIKFTDLLIGLFTYLTVLVGLYAMRLTDITTKRSERAYIFGGGPYGKRKPKPRFPKSFRSDERFNDPENFADNKCMTLSNYGKTNGFITRVRWGLVKLEHFPLGRRVSDIVDDREALPSRLIKPNGRIEEVEHPEMMLAPTISPSWIPFRPVEVYRPDYNGYVFFARIDYRDVFQNEWYSTFKLLLTNDGFSDPIDNSYADHT